MPMSGIAGSYCNSIFVFFEEPPYCFPSGYTNVYSYQQCRTALFYTHPLQHLLFVGFLMMTILTSVRWYLIVVLISLVMDGELRSLACCSSWGNKESDPTQRLNNNSQS